MNVNTGFNVVQEHSKFTSEKAETLPETMGENKQELGVSDTNYEKNVTLANVQTVIGDSTENYRMNTPKLNITLGDSSSPEKSELNASSGFSGETINEPLVDLSSGVALTPVACPDEARIWTLGESDDGESPGSEGFAGLQVTSRLFAGSNRDSPVSR